MHDLDSELAPGKYWSSSAFDYVVTEDILKDTEYIDSPFFINNMAELREAGLSLAENKSLSKNEEVG